MYKIYGSPLCPDCRECKANFDAHGIAYEEVNITGSMVELKEFLKLRDSEAVFAPCKERGSVGVPAIVKEDGSIELDWEKILKDKGLPVVFKETNGAMCSLDGSGC